MHQTLLDFAAAASAFFASGVAAADAVTPIDTAPPALRPVRMQPAHAQITHCPVTRRALSASGDDAAVTMALHLDGGSGAGNLLLVSRVAAQARAHLSATAILQRAVRLARTGAGAAPVDGLDAAAWARLATLTSFRQPLPQVQAVRIALRALPPAHVLPCNPAQTLQVALTRALQAPGWSRRAAAIADRLPLPALRHDFNLFVGALAARLMAVPLDADANELRWAQEDAWADARLQRRWAQFALQLDAAQCQALLERMAACRARALPRGCCGAQRSGAGSTSMRPHTSLPTRSKLALLPMASSSQPSVC